MSEPTAVDPMLAALGLSRHDALPEATQELLEDHVETFLRGGGRLSWPEWLTLSDASRVALANAGDRIRDDQADSVVTALLGCLDAMGKQALVHDAAVAALARKVKG